MKKLIFTLVLCVGMSGMLLAQSDNQTITLQIPKVAMLKLVSSAPLNFTLTFGQPTSAGNKLSPVSVPAIKTYLVYSSIVNSSGTGGYRTISVKTDVQPLDGTNLTVYAEAPASSGGGKKGVQQGLIPLSTASDILIDQIGSCYTGELVNNGHALNYGVSIPNGSAAYSTLVSGSRQYVVTYTLSEN